VAGKAANFSTCSSICRGGTLPLFTELPTRGLLENCRVKLAEKGLKQRSECGFGRYTEHEKGLWVVFRATL